MKYLILFISMILIGCASPGVIGVAYNQEGIVRYVYPESNAKKAGIMVGDKILNKSELRGKVDTSVLVRYIRNNISCEVSVVRQHIDTLKTSKNEW